MSASSTFFATDGNGYEAQMGRWSRRLAPLLIDFATISVAKHVLDAGCGTGSLAFALASNPHIGLVTGVDLASEYIAHASRHRLDPRVRFEVGDVTQLRFEDASFDHTLSSLVLQFVPEPDRALHEMRRVTRPGGIVAAATWDTRGGVVVQRMFFDTAAVIDSNAVRYRGVVCTREMSRRDGLLKAWHNAGLINVQADSLTIRMDYESFFDFWSSIDGRDGPYAGYLGTLADDIKQTLRGLVEAAYIDGEQDGPRSYAATAWTIRGQVP